MNLRTKCVLFTVFLTSCASTSTTLRAPSSKESCFKSITNFLKFTKEKKAPVVEKVPLETVTKLRGVVIGSPEVLLTRQDAIRELRSLNFYIGHYLKEYKSATGYFSQARNHRKLSEAIVYYNEYLEKIPKIYPASQNDDIIKELDAVIATFSKEMEGVKVANESTKKYLESSYEYYLLKRKYFTALAAKAEAEANSAQVAAKKIKRTPQFPKLEATPYKSPQLMELHAKIDALKVFGRHSDQVNEVVLEKGWKDADPGFNDVYQTVAVKMEIPNEASANDIKNILKEHLTSDYADDVKVRRFKMTKKKVNGVPYEAFMKLEVDANRAFQDEYPDAYQREAADVFHLIDEFRYQGHKNIEAFVLELEMDHPHPYVHARREFAQGFVTLDRNTNEVLIHTRRFELDVDEDGEIFDTRP